MPGDIKAYLSEISVVEVSLCGTPMVPEATIQVMKSAAAAVPQGCEKIERFIKFTKVDEVKKQVLLYALVPELPHRDGEAVHGDAVEKAAHSFLTNLSVGTQKGTGTGIDHKIFDGVGNCIESAIDKDGSLGKAYGFTDVYPGAWFIHIQCTDATWDKIIKGEITGVSIGGYAKRNPVEKSFVERGLDSLLRKAGYVPEVKVEAILKSIDFDQAMRLQEFWDNLPKMMDTIYSAIVSTMYEEGKTDAEKLSAIKESLDQFWAKMAQIMGVLEKMSKSVIELRKSTDKEPEKIEFNIDNDGGEKSPQEGEIEMQMTPEQFNKAIADGIAAALPDAVSKALTSKLDEIKKSAGDPDALQKSITELSAKLDKISKGEEGEITATMAKAVVNLHTKIENMAAVLKKSLGSNVVTEKSDDPPKKESSTDAIFKSLSMLAEEKLAASA
ncbi:MAG: XkdF-like putative serine protease domain-containing protein [Candidatus Zixiibacteriota bacterium]